MGGAKNFDEEMWEGGGDQSNYWKCFQFSNTYVDTSSFYDFSKQLCVHWL